jgi:ABC-type nickel/cobalt efflux system permease component RcnA
VRPNKNIVSHLRRVAGVIVCFLWCSPVSFAHPMGNFSINHYAGIHIDQGFIELRYLIDMAEIPTFQEMQQKGFAAKADDPRVRAYLSKQAEEFRKGLFLTVNDQPQLLETTSQDILFTIGAGNLPTMKFGLVYRAAVTRACTAATHCTLVYRDTNFAGRVGWKELIASRGKRIIIEDSSAPLHDRSGQLSNYPTDMVSSPPQDVSAKIIFLAESVAGASSDRAEVRRGPASSASRGTIAAIASGNQPAANGPPSSPSVSGSPFFHVASNRQRTPRNSFTELINPKQISLGIVLLAAIVAAGLGALHALEPGHGKTIVAAYLVGSKGTARHALLLGMIVTIAHTAGVYFLGGITLYAQKYVFPDRIYPFLGVLSGILIAGMGCYLFLQRFVGAEFTHSHVIPSAPTESWQSSPERHSSAISTRQLLILGTTGGIVPCPAALVVLLSAVALHRTGFGLFLIVAFSIGLAAVLIAMGLAAVFAGRIMSRLPVNGSLVQRWLPMASALMITGLGCLIAVRGLIAAGIVQFRLWS